jgi:hypothetical protein
MNNIQREILGILALLWENNPELRFGQLLFSLNILEFANKTNPNESDYNLRDIFMDFDEDTLKRIKMSNFYIKYLGGIEFKN